MNNISVIAVVIITAVLSTGCGKETEQHAIKRQKISGVTTTQVQFTPADAYYDTTGNVAAKTTSLVSSRVMGSVISVKVKEGDSVRTGDILAVLDNRDAVQRTTAAEAAVAEAEHARDAAAQQRSLADITYQRYKNLHDERVISRQEFDQVQAQKNVAEAESSRVNQMLNRTRANLEEARVQSAFFQVRSPISGIVTEKLIQTGILATPGMHLFTVEDNTQYKVEASIDAALVKQIAHQTLVQITSELTDTPLTGRITKIVPAIDPATRTFAIEITPERTSVFRSGTYVKVSIPMGKKKMLMIPQSAVSQRGQLTGVFVVEKENIVSYRLIKTGKVYNAQVEVLTGLADGETVIISGVEKAIDGGIVSK